MPSKSQHATLASFPFPPFQPIEGYRCFFRLLRRKEKVGQFSQTDRPQRQQAAAAECWSWRNGRTRGRPKPLTPTGASFVMAEPSELPSLDEAEQFLLRTQRGDRAGEATALADLGLLALERRNVSRAMPHLREALALARNVGDQAREGDILGLFGLAALVTRQVDLARAMSGAVAGFGATVGDASAEKLTLERLSAVSALTGDLSGAINLLADSLRAGSQPRRPAARGRPALAHGGPLCRVWPPWRGIGQRTSGGGSVRKAWQPTSQGVPRALVAFSARDGGAVRMAPDGGVSVTVLTTLPTADRASAGSGFRRGKRAVDYLRMAVSAARALTRFVGSGLKAVRAETLTFRRQQCGACVQYTGLRCRVCGCFTNLKLRLPHEECPLGRWADEKGDRHRN